MPRDLFGDVTDPSIKLGTRKWYAVPLSFFVHALAIGVLIVTPLLATGALPMPDTGSSIVHIEPPRMPEPPPVRRPTPPPVRRALSPDAAPVVAPDEIAREPEIDAGFEETASIELGVPGAGEIEVTGVVTPPPPVVTPPAAEPVRVGAHVRPPERIAYVAPVYPSLALTARVQGMVIVEAVIDDRGRVTSARVLRSDSPLLNDAALAALKQWQYTPTLLNGVPTAVIMTVSVHFKLQ